MISRDEARDFLEHDRPVTDLVSGRQGKILVDGDETAFVDFGPLLGSGWVPLDELADARRVIGE